MKHENKRIKYDVWVHSQLSVARHYGGIKINGEYYEFDREVVKEMKKGKQELYKPDLVLYK